MNFILKALKLAVPVLIIKLPFKMFLRITPPFTENNWHTKHTLYIPIRGPLTIAFNHNNN